MAREPQTGQDLGSQVDPQAERLYSLLPEFIRYEDALQGEPLRAVMKVLQAQYDLLHEDIGRLYDNWFIETCDEWVVPYIGDLLGVPHLPLAKEATYSHRTWVANTLAYRRRKGRTGVLAQALGDATGWPTRVREMRFAIARAPQLDGPLGSPVVADLRDLAALEHLGGPFDAVARGAAVRLRGSAAGERPHVDLAVPPSVDGIGLYQWRLSSYPRERGQACPIDTDRHQFTFHSLGVDQPLFNQPPTAIGLLDSRTELGERSVPWAAETIDAGRRSRSPSARPPAADRLSRSRPAGIRPLGTGERGFGGTPAVHRVAAGRQSAHLAGPPARRDFPHPGRPGGRHDRSHRRPGARPNRLRQGRPRSAALGELQLCRQRRPRWWSLRPTKQLDPGGRRHLDRGHRGALASRWRSCPTGLQEPRRRPAGRGRPRVPMRCSGCSTTTTTGYRQSFRIDLRSGRRLALEAGDGHTPTLIGDLQILGTEQDLGPIPVAGLTLNGLWFDGGLRLTGNLELEITDCTLKPRLPAPRSTTTIQASIYADPSADHGGLKVHLCSTICGALRLPASIHRLIVEDSVVDGGRGGLAIGGADTQHPGPICKLENVTIFGRTRIERLTSALNVLFTEQVTVEAPWERQGETLLRGGQFHDSTSATLLAQAGTLSGSAGLHITNIRPAGLCPTCQTMPRPLSILGQERRRNRGLSSPFPTTEPGQHRVGVARVSALGQTGPHRIRDLTRYRDLIQMPCRERVPEN